MTTTQKRSALVLFSGGQDSTVCLIWALERFEWVETIGFDYGQRHRVELEARREVLTAISGIDETWRERIGPDHLLDLTELSQISETSLTRESKIAYAETGLPTTFVPGRNLLFFTYAAAIAYRRSIPVLVGGMCETDFSGYPDCRNDTLQTLAKALSLGMNRTVRIETPLMWLDKADTWALADTLGGQPLIDLIITKTHTCYLGERTTRHAWGYGCGTCPACALRGEGWKKWSSRNPDRIANNTEN